MQAVNKTERRLWRALQQQRQFHGSRQSSFLNLLLRMPKPAAKEDENRRIDNEDLRRPTNLARDQVPPNRSPIQSTSKIAAGALDRAKTLSDLRDMVNSDHRVDLDQLQSVYHDLINPNANQDDDVPLWPEERTYSNFLTLAARCEGQGVSWAMELLKDMRDGEIQFKTTKIAMKHAVQLMSASESYSQAFSVYSWIAATSPQPFSLSQYNSLLHRFASLAYDRQDRSTKAQRDEAPPELFNEFLKDMRKSGNPPNTHTYAIMLGYYSRSFRNAEQIRRLHNAIKVDMQYDPDTTLLNSLIVAYGYVQDYPAAFGVWKSMVANNHRPNARIDHATVSCVLDVCASVRSYSTANNVWSLSRNNLGLVPNRRNWETWLECLCRCGAFAIAQDVLFRQMLTTDTNSDVPRLDAQSLEIVLSLAHRNNPTAYEEVLAQARRLTPELLEQIDLPSNSTETTHRLSSQSTTTESSDSEGGARFLSFVPFANSAFA